MNSWLFWLCVFGIQDTLQDPEIAKDVRRWVRALADENVQVREHATRQLIDLGPRAKKELEGLLALRKDPEVRSRLRHVLSEFHFTALKGTRFVKAGSFGGHLGAQRCLFSPDGSLLATSGRDGKVKLIRVPDLTEIASFALSVDTAVRPLGAFSRDGRLLLIGDAEGYLSLIDTQAREIRSRVRLSKYWRVTSCTLSPDGRFAAGKVYNSPIYLWDTRTNSASKVPGETTGTGNEPMPFSPDGRYLAYWDTSGVVRAVLTAPGSPPSRVISLPTGGYIAGSSISFTPDGKHLLAAGHTRQLFVVNLETGKLVHRFPQVRAHRISGSSIVMLSSKGQLSVSDLSALGKEKEIGKLGPGGLVLSPNGRYATGHSREIYDLKNRTRVGTVGASGDPVWVDDRAEVVALHAGHKLILWDVKNRKLMAEVMREQYQKNISISPSSDYVACATLNGRLRMIDVRKGGIETSEPHLGAVNTIALSPDGTKLATGAGDGSVRLWDVASQKLLGIWERPWSGVAKIQFSPDSRRMGVIGVGFYQGTFLYDLDSEKLLELPHPGSHENRLTFSSDSRMLVVSSSMGLYVWDCDEGKQLAGKKGDWRWPATCVGDTVVTFPYGACSIFLMSDLSPVSGFEMPGAGFCDVMKVSRDRRYVALESNIRRGPRIFQLWNLREKRKLHEELRPWQTEPGQAHPTFGPLAFSPGGLHLAVVRPDKDYRKGSLSIRETATWKKVASPEPPTPLSAFAHPYFQSSGRSLLTIGEKGQIKLWHLRLSRLREAAGASIEGLMDHRVSRDGTSIAGIVGADAVVLQLTPAEEN